MDTVIYYSAMNPPETCPACGRLLCKPKSVRAHFERHVSKRQMVKREDNWTVVECQKRGTFGTKYHKLIRLVDYRLPVPTDLG